MRVFPWMKYNCPSFEYRYRPIPNTWSVRLRFTFLIGIASFSCCVGLHGAACGLWGSYAAKDAGRAKKPTGGCFTAPCASHDFRFLWIYFFDRPLHLRQSNITWLIVPVHFYVSSAWVCLFLPCPHTSISVRFTVFRICWANFHVSGSTMASWVFSNLV